MNNIDTQAEMLDVEERRIVSRSLDAYRKMSPSEKIGTILVVFWLIVAIFGPMLAPYEVGAFVAEEVFDTASFTHILGTDYLGRDVLSRVLSGARYTVGLALASALTASAIGITIALFSVVSSRIVDEVISRLMDAFISIPSKILALVIVAAFGSSIPLLYIVVAITYIPGAFRIARSLAVGQNEMEYVIVARARGEGRAYIACVEIFPNIINPMLTDFGLRFIFAILLLSGLSFLGLGVQPPFADLGSLVRENMSGLAEGALAILAPSVAIATLTIGMNLMIDSLPHNNKKHGGEG
ncbi:MAG: DNA-directed RNA polymerase subunit alpha [Woeseiaceae bacterium]|nr:DNA-directed RNA polymerase subunit alpha [Woeseiaceae bacterium]